MPVFAGKVLLPQGAIDGWMAVEQGRIIACGKGEPEAAPEAVGWIVPSPVNAHTHVADAFLRPENKPRDVARLVGPGGWKHERLAKADPAQQARGTQAYVHEMASCGTAAFIDFREGGAAGAQWLRGLDLPAQAIIHGRPIEPGFDEDEAEALLPAVDGLGLSGMRDRPRRDLEAWADACRDARKPFGIHVSEDQRDDIDAVISLGPDYVVHMCHGKTRDFDELADARIPIVTCPRSNAWFQQPTPVRAMRDAGCTIAIGTDNGMLQDGDLIAETTVWTQRDPAVTEAEALTVMTYNGRRLAGLPDPAFRRGADADWVVLPSHPFLPRHHKPGLAPMQAIAQEPDDEFPWHRQGRRP